MEKNTHFTVGIYGDQDELVNGVKAIRNKGIKIHEVYTPYPVHFLEDALGYKRSWMPKAAFFFGLTGFILATLMQVLIMGIDWPMIIGGKSYVAIPDLVPVSFELTVLFAAFGMGFTFFAVRDLKPYAVPRVFDRRSTDDKHVVAIDLAVNNLSEAEISECLKENSAEEVFRKDFTEEENNPSFIAYLIDTVTNGVTSSSRKLN